MKRPANDRMFGGLQRTAISALPASVVIALRCGVPALLLAVALAGCVSKAKADARARAAFFAGQQQSMARAQQNLASPSVMVMGAVRNNRVPWTPDLTLANALIDADYIGQTDPKEILINRNGQQLHFDPKTLLTGQDVPVMTNDIIEIR